MKFRNLVNAILAAIEVWFGTYNVKRYGAKGDGVTSDDAAIDAAQVACHAAGGGVVYFPPGTYALTGTGIALKASHVIYRGAERRASRIIRTSGSGSLFVRSASFVRENITFEDLGFDLSGSGTIHAVDASSVALAGPLRLRRCRFWFGDGTASGFALSAAGMAHIDIDDNEFAAAGIGKGTALAFGSGTKHIAIRRNSFRWLANGISIDTGSTSVEADQDTVEYLDVEGNTFDGGWWLIRSLFSGSGAGVSYTATVLTDTGATFSGLTTSANQNVRAMPVLQTGTAFTTAGSALTDASATFRTNLVKRGHIVRTGTVFGVVASVESETTLQVEEWLNQSDHTPAATPATNTYTVYGIIIGLISAFTGTTITVARWYDLTGAAVTPSAATRYEVMNTRPNYHLFAEYGVRLAKVLNNTFRRGWSDQISLYGYDNVVAHNIVEDGQDMGLTVHGEHNIVQGNRVNHQGAGGIWTSMTDGIVDGNVVTDSQWCNHVNTTSLGDIILNDASRVRVINNHCERVNNALGYFGVVVRASSADSDGNIVEHNTTRNHLTAGVTAYADNTRTVSNLTVRDMTYLSEVAEVTTAGPGTASYLGTPYDVAGSVTSLPPASAIVGTFVAPRAFILPISLTGSYAKAGTAATASTTFTIKKNGASIGSFVFAIAGTVATFTFAAAVSFAAGDILTITSPAQDATLADVGWVLKGFL